MRLSEFLNYLLQYLVNNAQTLLDTMQLIDKLHTIKETKKDKTNINANLYELTTKYTMLLHSVLGIDDMFRD